MVRQTILRAFPLLAVLSGLALTGCGSSNLPTTPSAPAAVAVTETFSDTISVNGARTHPFANATTGAVSAQLTAVAPDGSHLGISLGTWNGAACQIIIANDDAVQSNAVTGNASVGQFCVRLYDVGKLTGPADYTVTVTHY